MMGKCDGEVNPSRWKLHCHVFTHVSTKELYKHVSVWY